MNKTGFPSEQVEQNQVVKYLKLRNIMHCAVANGGKRDAIEAARLRNQGVSPGFPDLFIAHPKPPYSGLMIEMKPKKGGKLTDSQTFWLEQLNKLGYLAVCARGFDEAKKYIDEYFSFN